MPHTVPRRNLTVMGVDMPRLMTVVTGLMMMIPGPLVCCSCGVDVGVANDGVEANGSAR